MKIKILLIVCLCFFFSCSNYKKSKLEESIEQKVNASCSGKNSCSISMNEVTSFEWDRMIVFKPIASLETINKVLGFKYPYYEDVAQRIVFLKGNDIIYHDDFYPTFDKGIEGILEFDFSDSIPYKEYSPTSANFEIEKRKSNGEYYYVLSH